MPTKINEYGAVTVVTTNDEIGGESLALFKDKVDKLFEKGGHQLILDCSELAGVDSEGLEYLLDLQDQCEEHLGALKICGASEALATILRITRLDRRFELFGDIDEAVKSFG